MSHRKEISLILSCSLCLAAIAALWSQAEGRGLAQVAVRYVGTLGLDIGNCTDLNQPCRTMQYALDSAEPGDIIKVASGTYTETNSHGNLAQVAYVDKDITVIGGYSAPGFPEPPNPVVNVTTIDAQGLGRGLVITGPVSATIEGLSITGGDATGLGGGPGGADAGGGALVAGATALIRESQLVFNFCQTCLGGGLALVDSTATLQGNQIASNHADLGGGVCITGGSATLNTNAVQDNIATDSGGGLYVVASDVLVDANAVSGNSADGAGGGVFLEASTASLTNNSISANSLAGNGGGVYIDGGDVVMAGNRITGNSSSWNSGGGVYLC